MKYYTSTTQFNCGIDLHARQIKAIDKVDLCWLGRISLSGKIDWRSLRMVGNQAGARSARRPDAFQGNPSPSVVSITARWWNEVAMANYPVAAENWSMSGLGFRWFLLCQSGSERLPRRLSR